MIGRRSRATKRLALTAIVLIAAISSTSAQAEYITYTFSGAINSVGYSGPPGEAPIPPVVPPGLPPELTQLDQLFDTPITGYVTVDNAAIDRNASVYQGSYGGPAVIPLFYMSLNGHTFSYDYRALQPNTTASLFVNNLDTQPQFGLPANGVYLQSNAGTGFFDSDPASDYAIFMALGFTEFDDLSLIDSDAMPNDLSAFDRLWTLQLSILDRSTGYSISYHSQEISLTRLVTPVPAPATALLFAAGMFAFGMRRRLFSAKRSL